MNTNYGIISFGAYVPTLRIDRAAITTANAWAFPGRKGSGARALASWDEDCITMSVEAARGVDTDGVDELVFASTTAPFADLQNASLVAAALGLKSGVGTQDASGSLRAGTSALLAALKNRAGESLIVAADARRARPGSAQELLYGAGAVAMRVGSGPVIARLIGSARRSEPFVDHFRATGEKYDYYWEERWVRDEGYGKILPPAVNEVLMQAGLRPSHIAHLCIPALLPGIGASLAKAMGMAPTTVGDTLQTHCGDTGAAHGLMMLAHTLERAKPGEHIVLVSFGAGCDVLLLQATDALAKHRIRQSVSAAIAAGRVEPSYTKLLSFHGELNLDWGMRGEGDDKVSLTQQYRAREQLAGFVAGVCPNCHAVQFPQLASCVNCASFATLTPCPLREVQAQVMSVTADWLQFHPAPPFYFGLVQFINGARVMMEFVDVPANSLKVGTPLRMVCRIKTADAKRNYTNHFWKAAPIIQVKEN